MSFFKELKIKYSENNFKKKSNEYLDNNTTELEVEVNIYIDGYHFFNELRDDALSILNVMSIADELFRKANPQIDLEEKIKEEYSDPMSHYISKVDYQLDHFKLCGLAQRYLLVEFEDLMRLNFKERGIDKIFGHFSQNEREKIRFDKKVNHLNSYIPTFLNYLIDDQMGELERRVIDSAQKGLSKDPADVFNSSSNSARKVNEVIKKFMETLRYIYGFSFELNKFDPNNKLDLRFKIEEEDYNNFFGYDSWYWWRKFIFDNLSPEKFNDKNYWILEPLPHKEISELFFEEFEKTKNYFNNNQKLILSFLDKHFDPKVRLDHLKNAIFVKLNFNYNLFRAHMDEEEFIKKAQYRKQMKTSIKDIQLYNNYSNLLEKTLRAKTQLGSYKWNAFSFKEKQVDTKITISCIKKMNETIDKNDLFCLVTNDTDFLPLFEEAKKMGANIFLCSTVIPQSISSELKKFLEIENVIFPKKYDFHTLKFALFSAFKEDERWPQWHYDNPEQIPYVPSPSSEIIELIESQESREELVKSLKNKVDEQIKILESLPSSIDKLTDELNLASERFIQKDTNILDFKK